MDGLNQILSAIRKKTDDLFAVEIDGIEIVFRLPPIRKAEQYRILLDMCSSECERVEIYEAIFRYVVEDDWLAYNNSDMPAGIPTTIARLVISLSGLGEESIQYTEQLFEAYRNQANNTLQYMKRFICHTFPGYTFETIDKLNYQQLVKVFVQAEIVAKENHSFSSPGDTVQQTNIDDIIREGEKNKPLRPVDPRLTERMRRISEGVKRRAELEQLRYFQQTNNNRQG